MRLSCILMTAVSALFVHLVPVTASVGSDAALTGVMSLAAFHLVGADQSVIDQSRFLRRNDVSKDDEEERGFTAADAKNLVTKMFKTNNFSALEKLDDLTALNKVSEAADDQLKSVFSLAQRNNMNADDLAIQLNKMPGLEESIIAKAVALYSNYLRSG